MCLSYRNITTKNSCCAHNYLRFMCNCIDYVFTKIDFTHVIFYSKGGFSDTAVEQLKAFYAFIA